MVVNLARAAAFDFLFDAVVVIDVEGIVADWNAGAERLYGYTKGEIFGRPMSILHAPEQAGALTAEIFAGIERDGHWSGEIQRVHRDGTLGWIESFVVPLVDTDGKPRGALGINRDITVRKQAEHVVQSAEKRWRTLFEHSPDGILVVDAAGTITLANEGMTRLLGYSREEMLGAPVESLLPQRLRGSHQGERREFVANSEPRVMGGGRLLVGLHRDGREVPVEIGLSTFQVDDALWTMAIVHDVSERERAIEQLRIQSAALDAAANGIAISSPRGVCQWVNPAFTRMTGYAADEIVGQPLSKLRSGVHDEAFFRELWTTIAAGKPWQGAIVNRRKDGTQYTEEQTIAPVFDASGAITHYVAIKSDVSERNRMEVELREANERLAQQLEEIRRLKDELQEQAIRDPLTQLYNRRYLEETLAKDVAIAERFDRPLTVAVVDVDHFKRVNDEHGHATGDLVLKRLADILLRQTRRTDLVCRLGGEEFAVVMPGARFFHGERRADQLRTAFAAAPLALGRSRIECTLSAGVAEYRRGFESIETTFERADAALYEAKRSGRNRVVSAEEAGTLRPGAIVADAPDSLESRDLARSG